MSEQQKNFTHLHVHTEYSLLDGACRIDRMFEHLKEMGQTAAAITDHGVMYGCVQMGEILLGIRHFRFSPAGLWLYQ